MKLKIFMIFALINILIPINASAETIINGNFKNISINDELSNEYITTIFYVSIILVFCIYVFYVTIFYRYVRGSFYAGSANPLLSQNRIH